VNRATATGCRISMRPFAVAHSADYCFACAAVQDSTRSPQLAIC